MATGFLPLLLLIVSGTVSASRNDSCCYGTIEDIANGQVIDSFPSKCMQLLCHEGMTEPRYYDDPAQCGCCLHAGKMYRNGERINGVCTDMTCMDGRWVTQGYLDECCEMCHFINDPHITTFDGYYYHWHGTCNYSISQPNFGYNEPFGIYGQYTQCNGLASCVDITTFKDNPHTVIQVTHSQGPNVLVNDNPVTVSGSVDTLPAGDPSHPVLAWTDGSCNWFLGSQGFLLKTCSDQIFVWAYPNLVGQLYGLCGSLNLYMPDDFTDRTGFPDTLQSYPTSFPVSWLTADQTQPGCDPLTTNPDIVPDPCTLGEDGLKRLKKVCTTLFVNVRWEGHKGSRVIINIAIQSCIADLCLMEQHGATSTQIQKWKIQMQIMLEIRIRIEIKTTVGALPPKPSHTGCSESGGCKHGSHFSAQVQIQTNLGR